MSAHFDVIIVGSGAGGATLAQRLAPTGKTILILERGQHLPREAENWDPKTVFIDQKYRTKEQWVDRRGKPFTPNTFYWVGGNTTFYGAALMRLRQSDFEETTHAGGVSPRLAAAAGRHGALLRRGRAALAGAWRARRSIRPRSGTSRPTPISAIHHDPGIAPADAPTCRSQAGSRSRCRWGSIWTRPIR